MVRKINPEYLKRTADSSAVRRIKTRALETLGLAAGTRVVDIGCGPAIDTVEMARLVGPTGFVLGIDGDPVMVDQANQTAIREGVGAFTRHILGDATALAQRSGDFDACFCERVLQHLSWVDVGRAAREIVRVVRSRGRIAVIDTDWATLSVGSGNPLLERRIIREHALRFPNPFSGRYLLLAFRTAGLDNINIETFNLQLSFEAVEFLLRPAIEGGIASGRISAFEAGRWFLELYAARDYGVFFAHVGIVLLTGGKK